MTTLTAPPVAARRRLPAPARPGLVNALGTLAGHELSQGTILNDFLRRLLLRPKLFRARATRR